MISKEQLIDRINALWQLIPDPPTYADFNKVYKFGANGILTRSIDPNIQTHKPYTYDEALTHITFLSNIVMWGWGYKLKPIVDPETNIINSWILSE
jgi:hypothetical protein